MQWRDRVQESSVTVGTGPLALDGALFSFRSFGSAVTSGQMVDYVITEVASGAWEVGRGVFTTPNTLARGLLSSSTGALLNLAVGAKVVTHCVAAATIESLLQSPINVALYGAGGGVTDDVARIQAAISAMPANGGSLYFPTGTYLLGSSLTFNKPGTYYGDGWATVLRSTSTTANAITVTGAESVHIRNLRLNSSVTKTDGWFVELASSANRFRMSNFAMDGGFGGFRTAAVATVTFESGQILNCAPGVGIMGRIDAGLDVTLRDIISDHAVNIFAGLYLVNSGDVTIEDCNWIHCGNVLHVNCGAGNTIASLWASNSFFDTSVRGLLVDASAGQMVRCMFNSCWFGGHSQQGVLIQPSGSAYVRGIEFNDCHVLLNTIDGINVASSAVRDFKVHGGQFSANGGSGIAIAAGVSNFQIQDARIGNTGDLSGNTTGISIAAGASDNYMITDNNMTGNGTTLVNGATGVNRIVANNLGVAQGATTAITVTASPFTYTAGASPETVYINGGVVSLVTIDGAGVFQQTNCSLKLNPGKSMVVSYSSLPGMAKTVE